MLPPVSYFSARSKRKEEEGEKKTVLMDFTLIHDKMHDSAYIRLNLAKLAMTWPGLTPLIFHTLKLALGNVRLRHDK